MQGNRIARLVAGIVALSFILAACSPAGGGAASVAPSASGGDKGTINIAINPWVGAEANVAVIKNLLETKLGYKVEATSIAEEIAWPGFETGEIDVILENWGHPDLEATYIAEKKVALDAGPNGITGVIGWYVPEWMVERVPGHHATGTTSTSTPSCSRPRNRATKGQFLASDPTFVTNDEALITNLKLNYKAVYSGSEAATHHGLPDGDGAEEAAHRLLLRPAVGCTARSSSCKVKLPPYTAGCDADPKKVACDYPPYTLNKIVATKFAETGGDAYTLVKNFQWTNADQNLVADYITNQGMTADEAGAKWVADNEAVWKAWLP